MKLPIPDRQAAGQALAEALHKYRDRDDLIILALPRGGVPVALVIASALAAPLDLMLVRKLGTPGQEELAMGAIASGGGRVMNQDVVQALAIPDQVIERVAGQESRELQRRERVYRGDRPWPDIEGRCVILVDDGLATGATMRAAVEAVRAQRPAHIVVAVGVAPQDTIALLREQADDVVCLAEPEPFRAIGLWYEDFSQLSDEEVCQMLARAWNKPTGNS
jgi:putative phosphoribosyl transferase